MGYRLRVFRRSSVELSEGRLADDPARLPKLPRTEAVDLIARLVPARIPTPLDPRGGNAALYELVVVRLAGGSWR